MAKNGLMILMIFYYWSLVGICRGEGIGIGEGDDEPPCFTKILACTLYLHQTITPTGACCGPVKQLVSSDAKCFCDVFSNAAIMITLNVTQADALALAKSCGSNVGPHFCKNAASSPTVSPSPSNSSTSSPSSNSPNTNSTANAPPESAASSVSKFGESLILVMLFSIISMF